MAADHHQRMKNQVTKESRKDSPFPHDNGLRVSGSERKTVNFEKIGSETWMPAIEIFNRLMAGMRIDSMWLQVEGWPQAKKMAALHLLREAPEHFQCRHSPYSF
jgi:hypothetical protein